MGGSTANWRGYCMIYGVNDVNQLTVKRIEIHGDEILPIAHNYARIKDDIGGESYVNFDHIIPISGYLLFSPDVWTVKHLFLDSIDPDGHQYRLYEASVKDGVVTEISECSDQVRQNSKAHNYESFIHLWRGFTDEERLANIENVWDETARLLPHKYDTLHMGIWYFAFNETIKELRSKLSNETG